MKHKSLKHLLLGVGVCSFIVSLSVKADVNEHAPVISNSQAKVSDGLGNSQVAAVAASSAQFRMAQLDVGTASVNMLSPVQEMAVHFRAYDNPDDPAYSRAPDPPVFILVLIGLLGLLVGRRRFR